MQGKDEANSHSVNPELSPFEQYLDLVKRHDDAIAAYYEAAQGLTSDEEVVAAWLRLRPRLDEFVPAFVALAERYPDDPVAVDALLWGVEKTRTGRSDIRDNILGRSIGRAMEILANHYAEEPRLGSLSLAMNTSISPRRESFLRTLADLSQDRVVKGQAMLGLARYPGTPSVWYEMIQRPDAPENAGKAGIPATIEPRSAGGPSQHPDREHRGDTA